MSATSNQSSSAAATVRLTPSSATNPLSCDHRRKRGRRFDSHALALPFVSSIEYARRRIDVTVDQMPAEAIADAQRVLDVDYVADCAFA